MNYEAAAEFAMNYALKKGAEFVDVRADYEIGNAFAMHNGVLNFASSSTSEGIGVRVKNKGWSFFSTNKLEKEFIKKLVSKAINQAQKIKLKDDVKLSDERTYKRTYSAKEKIKVSSLSPDEKIKLLKDLEKETKNSAEGRTYYLSDTQRERIILTSEGTRIKSYIPQVYSYYVISVINNSKTSEHFLSFGASSGYESWKKWNLAERIKREAGTLKKSLKYGKTIKPGFKDVVVAPEVTGIIVHESCGHPLEADRVLGREAAQAGESFVKPNMLGQLIGGVNVNIADDPTLPGSFGFYLFDDEGVKARRKMLMKNGRINEFLHNRESAYALGTKSNGSARSTSYSFEPIVRMSNTFMLPGDYKEEELIENVKDGVYIKSFMEWNIDDKRLNQKYVGAEAYVIKNGKLGKPLLNPVIEITTPQLYKAVDAVANNTEYFAGTCGKGEPMQGIPVWFGGPSFRMRRIFVR